MYVCCGPILVCFLFSIISFFCIISHFCDVIVRALVRHAVNSIVIVMCEIISISVVSRVQFSDGTSLSNYDIDTVVLQVETVRLVQV